MGHWYTKDGEAKHFIEKTTSKGTRPTTIADARKHNLVPFRKNLHGQCRKCGKDRWLNNLDLCLKCQRQQEKS